MTHPDSPGGPPDLCRTSGRTSRTFVRNTRPHPTLRESLPTPPGPPFRPILDVREGFQDLRLGLPTPACPAGGLTTPSQTSGRA